EPNVLILDEPTNDLDIDTLTVIEDYLDTWPGTLIVVSHDRYFLERVTDVSYALLGDGSCVLLPGGVEEYLARRKAMHAGPGSGIDSSADRPVSDAAAERQRKKDLSRLESQLSKVDKNIRRLHEKMTASASDYAQLATLTADLHTAEARRDELEEAWLLAADDV
ncbi:MAG: ABC transporter ATP-binding protein, partial [Propionibacteriaceae bacterium]|nr:ABC transporter ATP-binding protein [Propionibacteriaceae bacterium]